MSAHPDEMFDGSVNFGGHKPNLLPGIPALAPPQAMTKRLFVQQYVLATHGKTHHAAAIRDAVQVWEAIEKACP